MKRFLIYSTFLMILAGIAVGQVNQKARTAQNEANNLYYDGKIKEALSKYKQILEEYPNYDSKNRVLIMMGRCYSKLGKDTLAVKNYRKVIDADPDDSYASQAVSLMGNLFRQRYQYKEAVLVCKQITQKYPDTLAASMAMYLIPTYLYYEGKIEEAIKGYNKFIEEFPTSPFRSSAFSSLVNLYISKRKFDEAETMILRNMKQHPDDTDLMKELASVYQRKGEHDKALELYKSALKTNPDNTDLLKKIGELYVQLGEKQKAIEMWAKIRTGSSNYYRHQRLASIYKQQGFYEEAIKEYKTAIKLKPKSSYLYTKLAEVYKIQGQTDRMVDVYLDALFKLGVSYGGRATIISDLNELYSGEQKQSFFSDIITKVQNKLQNNRNDHVVWLTLAEMQFYKADYEESLKSFKRFAKLYPNDRGRFLKNYGEILEYVENPYALEFYKAIVEEFPSSPYKSRVQLSRAKLNYKLKRWNDALAVLKDITRRRRDLEAYLLMGKVYLYGLHDVSSAKKVYEKARLFGGSHSEEIQLRLAECEILLGTDTDENAKQILEPLVTQGSRVKVEARKLMGDLYFYQGNFETAKKEYQKVIETGKDNELTNDAMKQLAIISANSDYLGQPLSIYAQARQLELSGDINGAIEMYQSILKQFPKCTMTDDARLAIANLYLITGEIDKAIAAYEKVIGSGSPFSAEAQAKIADIYLERIDEQDKALDAYSKLLKKYPDSVLTTYARKKIESMK